MTKTQTALGSIRRDNLSPRRPFDGKLQEVTGKLSLWLGGLQNLVRSFPRQELTRNGPAGYPLSYAIKMTFILSICYPPLYCPTHSVKASLTQIGKWTGPSCPQPWCVMSLVLMAFLPAGQKYSPPTWNMQLDLRKGLLKEAIPNFGLP